MGFFILHDLEILSEILQIFFNFLFNFWNGVIRRPKSGDGLAVFVNDEFGEVPFDEVCEETSLLLFEKVPERMGAATIDVDLGEHVKGDTVFIDSKRFYICVRSRLLGLHTLLKILVRLEFEIKLEPLLLYRPTAAAPPPAPGTAAAPLF